MADHYNILRVPKTASKDEIKDAFHKLAKEYHPDKHAQSQKFIRDAATRKFKQISEAYEVLIDDRKRTAYNLSYKNGERAFYSRYGGCSYSYTNGNYYGGGGGGSYYKASSQGSSSSSSSRARSSKLDAVFRFMATRTFILNLVFAGVFIGGTVSLNMSGEMLWKMHNPGKSFEEAVDCIEKEKARKDK